MNGNKRFQRNSLCFFNYDYKKEFNQKNLGSQGKVVNGEFKKLCEAEGLKIYATTSDSKVEFTERTIRSVEKELFSTGWRIKDTGTLKNSFFLPQISFPETTA